mmetsp:Transcript_71721/g.191352  ORF Transcript_71721/g.191352 Transcript_71721/m.191352 type:complete len:290 (-) Transcript_71721:38-907(-)
MEDLAGADADPGMDLRQPPRRPARAELRKSRLLGQRRVAGRRDMVLQFVGGVPEGHDGVANILADRPPGLVDGLGHGVEVLGEEGHQQAGVHLVRHVGEIQHGGEHDRGIALLDSQPRHPLAEVHHPHHRVRDVGGEGLEVGGHLDEALPHRHDLAEGLGARDGPDAVGEVQHRGAVHPGRDAVEHRRYLARQEGDEPRPRRKNGRHNDGHGNHVGSGLVPDVALRRCNVAGNLSLRAQRLARGMRDCVVQRSPVHSGVHHEDEKHLIGLRVTGQGTAATAAVSACRCT